jgi:hypothetical protein
MLGLAENNFKTCGVPHGTQYAEKDLTKTMKYRNIIPKRSKQLNTRKSQVEVTGASGLIIK